jgi:DNA anti-recombination protein RmuC
MKRKTTLLIIIFLSFLAFYPFLVKAESELTAEQDSTLEITNKPESLKDRIEAQKDKRAALEVTRQAEREEKKTELEKNKEEMKLKRESFRETLQAEKEERKTKIEEMRQTFKEKRDDFKEKIETIKDERKKELTEKIDNRMSTVNKNQTSRMTNALGKLTEHINKLDERLTQAKADGVDVSSVETLITTAKTAISTALVAVEEQAAKDYAFTIIDEENLGQSVKSSYDTLSQDLKKVQELLVKAKESVVNAYKAAEILKKIAPTPTVGVL